MPVCKYCLGIFDEISDHVDRDLVAHSWVDCRDKAANEALLVRSLLRLEPWHDTTLAVRVLYEEGREAFEAKRASSTTSV